MKKALNRGANPHGHGHGHGAGPRADVPPRWAGGLQRTSHSLSSKTFVTAPATNVFQPRLLHTSAVVKDAPEVPDFSP
ncbi:hypothetical protein MPER_08521 [Moniliophthora perniciosa FA553]|nr:hypothetical protein MPER_08521 [Moniliophthora perniciosa FA553]